MDQRPGLPSAMSLVQMNAGPGRERVSLIHLIVAGAPGPVSQKMG